MSDPRTQAATIDFGEIDYQPGRQVLALEAIAASLERISDQLERDACKCIHVGGSIPAMDTSACPIHSPHRIRLTASEGSGTLPSRPGQVRPEAGSPGAPR